MPPAPDRFLAAKKFCRKKTYNKYSRTNGWMTFQPNYQLKSNEFQQLSTVFVKMNAQIFVGPFFNRVFPTGEKHAHMAGV